MAAFKTLTAETLYAAHARGAVARQTFNQTLSELRDQVTGQDQVELLARSAFYLFMGQLRPKPGGRSGGLEVFHLEILQALALSRPRSAMPSVDEASAAAQRSFSLIDTNGRAYRQMAEEKLVADVAANEKQALLDLIRFWTFAVRGARHVHQTNEFAGIFATRIERYFRPVHGCSAAAVLETLQNIVRLIEKRIGDHLSRLKLWMRKSTSTAMIQAYAAQDPNLDLEGLRKALAGQNKRQVRAYLWNASEAAFASVFTFDQDDVVADIHAPERASLLAILRRLSIGFGELPEADLKHLHVSNAVRLKPIIRLSDTVFFCWCPQSLAIGFAEILQDLCAETPTLQRRGEDLRADWLEEKLAAIVKAALPSAAVHTGVKQLDAFGGTLWETDVVAIVDKTVLIFEAKSGKLHPAAGRGAFGTLKTDLQELVAEASKQSLRLKQLLDGATDPVHLISDQGALVIDPGLVRSVSRLNVLLEPVGPLLAHWPRLVAAGLLKADADLAPSMTIFELETVLEVLPYQLERCFYLARRAEFERNATYTADELDLLAFYLHNQFNVGEDEYEGRDFQIYGWSLELAAGYSERRAQGLPPPPVRRTALWNRLLDQLETQQSVGWTRMGRRLLRVDYESQIAFERVLRKGWRDVGRTPNTFFTTGFTFGQTGRKHTVALCIGAPTDSDLFSQNIRYACDSAFAQSGGSDLLLLYWATPATGNGCDFIGVMTKRPAGAGLQPFDGSGHAHRPSA